MSLLLLTILVHCSNALLQSLIIALFISVLLMLLVSFRSYVNYVVVIAAVVISICGLPFVSAKSQK